MLKINPLVVTNEFLNQSISPIVFSMLPTAIGLSSPLLLGVLDLKNGGDGRPQNLNDKYMASSNTMMSGPSLL